jgi:hypothetical protein
VGKGSGGRGRATRLVLGGVLLAATVAGLGVEGRGAGGSSRLAAAPSFRPVTGAISTAPEVVSGGPSSAGLAASGGQFAATGRSRAGASPRTYTPSTRAVETAPPINVREAAAREAKSPPPQAPAITEADAPQAGPGPRPGVPIGKVPPTPPPSSTGPSPGPTKTFKGEFLSSTSIPPDTMGAVGTDFVVNVTNDRMRVQTRDGVELSRVTLNSFWAGSTVKGVAVSSAFDPKVYYDRFNNRFILVASLNGPGINSGAGVAVTQTSDPTGLWNRFTVASDPTSTASAGHAIDYPSVGFNTNWIVVDENTFNYSGTAFTSYWGQQIFVLDKAAAYANTLGSVSLFEDPVTNCTTPFETKLSCGFTMAPSINTDNTTTTDYLVEDFDNVAGQLRLSKLTGTPAVPVLTVGIQFPQSPNSWRFDARRIGTTGGYTPQRQQSANLTSGTRMMANDSRIQNTVLRNGSLWTTHTVMLASTPTAAGTVIGGSGNPIIDQHSAVQWWKIDPTIETGLSTPPLDRGLIEDPTADNCHDGNGGTRTTGTCISTATQHGTFFAFPNISVNKNDDVLIGFTQFSALTYPNSAYAMRLAADPAGSMRDPVVFRPGQANYNIGAGAGGTTARQNRWGDYSAAQTDPVNDTDFWTVQEYAGTVRDFGIGLAGNWETWWALVNPSTTPPSTSGGLEIGEFRLRGPQGVRDEFVELYNPSSTPVIVNTTDNSDGWALAAATSAAVVSGVAVVPNGTVIPGRGHFLLADNPDAANGPTLSYSLNAYPGIQVRGADSDTGWSIDLPDTDSLALFKTADTASFTAPNRLDAAGPVGATFVEGTGYGALPTTNLQYTMFRKLTSGTPQDTNDNAADFQFADTAGTSTPAGQRLGAPGPENLDGPIYYALTETLLDPGVAATAAPNRVYDPTPDPGNNSTLGTITLRRTFTNNTGRPLTRLRFRIVDITTAGSPPGSADLRARTSPGPETVPISGTPPNPACPANSCTVQASTIEVPPAQALSGGLNTSLSAGTVTLTAPTRLKTPLPSGSSITVNFLLGEQSAGTEQFVVRAEGIQMPQLSPTAVSLRTFGATRSAGGVRLSWRTASEVGVVGYDVYGEVAGRRVKLNRGLIATKHAAAGATYRFTYAGTLAPERFWLRAARQDGSRTWLGPASIR